MKRRSRSTEAADLAIEDTRIADGLDAFASESQGGSFPAPAVAPEVAELDLFLSEDWPSTGGGSFPPALATGSPPRGDRSALLATVAASALLFTGSFWFTVASQKPGPPQVAPQPAAAAISLATPAEELPLAATVHRATMAETPAAAVPEVVADVAAAVSTPAAPSLERASAAPAVLDAPAPLLPPRVQETPSEEPRALSEPTLAATLPLAAAPPVAIAPASTPVIVASIPAPEPPSPPNAAPAAAHRERAHIAEIEAVLAHYRTAFGALDTNAVAAVWPEVDARALSRAFRSLEQQEIAFTQCAIDAADVTATAVCGGTVRYVPRIGGRSVRAEQRQWHFTMRRIGARWRIETVVSR